MGFVAGITSVFLGLGRLVVTPALWGWSLLPVLLTFALLVGIACFGHGVLIDEVRAWVGDGTGGSAVALTAASLAFWIVYLFVSYFAFAFFVRLVAAPLLALLADRTVAGLIGRPSPAGPGGPLSRWVVRPLFEALVVFLLRCVVTIAALPLLLVPVAGAVLFSVAMMTTLGLDLLDIAQSARGVLLGARLSFIGRNLGACAGLGVGAGVLLLVPCAGALFLPALVVAAVLLDSRIAPDFPRAAVA
jgi:uncharacterized protein involved in cysteine biosynthesis